MKYWRAFFIVAGLYNVLGGTAGFLTAERALDPPPTYPFIFRLLFLAVVVLGIGYLLVARAPRRNRDLVWVGLLTKVAGFVMTYWAIWDGQIPSSDWWQPLINDFPWAVGFAAFLITVPPLEEDRR